MWQQIMEDDLILLCFFKRPFMSEVLYIFTKLSQIVCLINLQILAFKKNSYLDHPSDSDVPVMWYMQKTRVKCFLCLRISTFSVCSQSRFLVAAHLQNIQNIIYGFNLFSTNISLVSLYFVELRSHRPTD